MADDTIEIQLRGLASILARDGLLSEATIKESIKEARERKVRLISYLVSNKLVVGKAVAIKASKEFGLPLLDLEAMDWHNLPIKLIDEKLIRKHNALPLYARGKTLFIAMSDPTNHQAVEDIKFQSLMRPEIILVEEDKLGRAIEIALEKPEASMMDMLDSDLENLDIAADENAIVVDNNSEIDEAPIVRFCNKILLDAVKKGASDIHF